jgi:Fic family protein
VGAVKLDAALVTPPPERLDVLLADLVDMPTATTSTRSLRPVVHAQFEVIHPFGDGNGRIGRVLISWLLARRMALVTPPPVSLRLAPAGTANAVTRRR